MIIGKAISPFALRKKNGGGGSYDADAQLFITATGISGTNATATNQLVIDLKAANIWSKMKAIYPLVGGTATSHKFNLKDTRDLDIAFRLAFAGGVTHSSSGILGSVNGYADTFLNMSTSYSTAYNLHFSFNIYTDWITSADIKTHIGANGGLSNNQYKIYTAAVTSEQSIMGINTPTVNKTGLTTTTHKGFWCGNRTANNLHNFIGPDGVITTNTNLDSLLLPNVNVALLCQKLVSGQSQYSNLGYSFFSIGNGLTTTELTALKTAQTNFQTTLGRI